MDNKLSELSKPAAWEMRYWNSGYNMWGEWERITAEQHAEMSVQHATDNDYEFRVLYDAPPAIAVPEIDRKAISEKVYGMCSRIPGATFYNAAEFAIDEVEARCASLRNAQSVAVVPDEITAHAIAPYSGAEYEAGYRDGWNACRAAMLAQPVSQSYKLPVELHNYDGGCVVFGAADDANEAPEGGK
ncbi:hypothetical protein [Serratia nevei]|uniref:hypothetical protein n=1 Tax=Serratia nevei TaxID=2703794 RepID=UPI00313B9159